MATRAGRRSKPFRETVPPPLAVPSTNGGAAVDLLNDDDDYQDSNDPSKSYTKGFDKKTNVILQQLLPLVRGDTATRNYVESLINEGLATKSDDELQGIIADVLIAAANLKSNELNQTLAPYRGKRANRVNVDINDLYRELLGQRASQNTVVTTPLQTNREALESSLPISAGFNISQRLHLKSRLTDNYTVQDLLKKKDFEGAKRALQAQIEPLLASIHEVYEAQNKRIVLLKNRSDDDKKDYARALKLEMDRADKQVADYASIQADKIRQAELSSRRPPPSSALPSLPTAALRNPASSNRASVRQNSSLLGESLVDALNSDEDDMTQLNAQLKEDREQYYAKLQESVNIALQHDQRDLDGPPIAFGVFANKRQEANHRIQRLQKRNASPNVLAAEMDRLLQFERHVARAIQRVEQTRLNREASHLKQDAARVKRGEQSIVATQKQDAQRLKRLAASATSSAKARTSSVASLARGRAVNLGTRFKDEFLGENIARRQYTWWNDPNLITATALFGVALVGVITCVCGLISSNAIVAKTSKYKKSDKERAEQLRWVFIIALIVSILGVLGVPIGWSLYRKRQASATTTTADGT